jgi:hypothetical protein
MMSWGEVVLVAAFQYPLAATGMCSDTVWTTNAAILVGILRGAVEGLTFVEKRMVTCVRAC